MGTMVHHAIVVTSWKPEVLAEAHAKALVMRCQVTPIMKAECNGYTSFAVLPDGSKEGWSESDIGDAARDGLVKWLNAQRYDDGSSCLSWVEIAFGEIGPENGARVERHVYETETHTKGAAK